MQKEIPAILKDLPAYAIGGCGIVLPKLADLAIVAQQISVILGCFVVFVTLLHRIYLFYKDTKK